MRYDTVSVGSRTVGSVTLVLAAVLLASALLAAPAAAGDDVEVEPGPVVFGDEDVETDDVGTVVEDRHAGYDDYEVVDEGDEDTQDALGTHGIDTFADDNVDVGGFEVAVE